MKPSFTDIYVKKIYGDVVECEECLGVGSTRPHEKVVECECCGGKGFVKRENKVTISN